MKAKKIKVRRTWGDLKPQTRVLKNKKIYSRKNKFDSNSD
jgi:hypothetical protein